MIKHPVTEPVNADDPFDGLFDADLLKCAMYALSDRFNPSAVAAREKLQRTLPQQPRPLGARPRLTRLSRNPSSSKWRKSRDAANLLASERSTPSSILSRGYVGMFWDNYHAGLNNFETGMSFASDQETRPRYFDVNPQGSSQCLNWRGD